LIFIHILPHLAVLMLTLLLVACGGGESSSPTDDSTKDSQGTATSVSVVFTALPASTPTSASVTVEHSYEKNAGPDKNPQKGWNSGWWDEGHSEASVGFQYIPWKNFEPSNGVFDYTAIEDIISRSGSRGRHLVLRLFCDWYGDEFTSNACPAWLYSEVGVDRLQGENGRYITDYNNPDFINEAVQAIEALAAVYDNDPRLYAVQMGILGYWGEWHTHGSSFDGSSFPLEYATTSAILNAYKSNFINKKIMGRYPWRNPAGSAGGIGFHNDYFVAEDGHSDEFDEAVAVGAKWRDGPIGGEVPPRSSDEKIRERSILYETSKGNSMIDTGHYSTMKPGSYIRKEGWSNYDGYMRLHKRMGYNYQIDHARFSETFTAAEDLLVELVGTNIGVAPIYYDWNVQIALLDSNDEPVVLTEVITDLTSIMPSNFFTFSAALAGDSMTSGVYKLAIRIIQPDADQAKDSVWKLDARNTYILFSNELPVIAGAWGSDNALIGGWSLLGEVTVD
jgi:hypothetical protein